MNYFIAKLASWIALGGTAALLIGCATTERDVARSIDFTPQIIQQSSDLIGADPDLSRQAIVIDGFHGAMRLKGEVKTPEQRTRAEKILWAVTGVQSVKNELKIVAIPGSSKPVYQ